jgi:hypothetical protein
LRGCVDFHAFRRFLWNQTHLFTLFAKDSATMTRGAGKAGLTLDGPYAACDKGVKKRSIGRDLRKLAQAGMKWVRLGIADINAGMASSLP